MPSAHLDVRGALVKSPFVHIAVSSIACSGGRNRHEPDGMLGSGG